MADKQTPFHQRHVGAGARMVSFAGYAMPLLYTSIQSEHEAVRNNVGMFDLSHMGEVMVRGAGALDYLQKVTTNDVAALEPGQVQYSAMCYPEGGIVDDLLVYRLDEGYMLVINASNIDKDTEWLQRHLAGDVDLDNQSDAMGLLAIQGPHAEAVVCRMTDAPLADLPFYWSSLARFGKHELICSRTGYTGEDGFEIYCPNSAASDLWDLAVEAGAHHDMALVGLGARDSLRLEMRYALYGHEIDGDTNPIAAGLGWICNPEKGDFIGRETIAAMKANGPEQKLVCLELGPKAIPRQHYKVFSGDHEVGEVRSGVFSPSLKHGIATAYVPTTLSRAGTQLAIEIRGRLESAIVVKPPFYKDGSHR
jgi:aminomethyltransferase